MPGQSKVNGAWKTITGLSVKVGGQWKTATSGYIKVGGQWKQWFASKIQDAFNRASTTLGLGTSDSGQVWNSLRGNWRISGSNTAISDDAGSSYALSAINLGNTDVKVQTDTTGGVGAAFWVSDAGSWWASYPVYSSSSNTTPITGFCYTAASSYTVTRRGCYTQSTANCNQVQYTSSGACAGPYGGGTACTGSSSCTCTGSGCTCTPSGTSCTGAASCSDSGTSTPCNQFWSGTGGYNSQCCASLSSFTYTNYSSGTCSTYGQCSGTISGGTTTEYFMIDRYLNGVSGAQDSCANYGASSASCSFCTCNQFLLCCQRQVTSTITCSCTYETVYSCSIPGTPTVTRTCSFGVLQSQPSYWYGYGASSCNAGVNYCYSSGCTPGGCCSGVFDASYVDSTCNLGGASCNGAGCTPSGCCSGVSYSGGVTTTTYVTDLVIVSSVSNSVVSAASTTLSTNTSGYTTVGSLFVTTSGNTVNAQAFAASNLGGGQVGSTLSHTATNPTKGTSVGIIKAPSSGSQGSTTDNFLATI